MQGQFKTPVKPLFPSQNRGEKLHDDIQKTERDKFWVVDLLLTCRCHSPIDCNLPFSHRHTDLAHAKSLDLFLAEKELATDGLFGANGFVPLGLVGLPVERKILPRHLGIFIKLSPLRITPSSSCEPSTPSSNTRTSIIITSINHLLLHKIDYPMAYLPYRNRHARTRDFDTGMPWSSRLVKIRISHEEETKHCENIFINPSTISFSNATYATYQRWSCNTSTWVSVSH